MSIFVQQKPIEKIADGAERALLGTAGVVAGTGWTRNEYTDADTGAVCIAGGINDHCFGPGWYNYGPAHHYGYPGLCASAAKYALIAHWINTVGTRELQYMPCGPVDGSAHYSGGVVLINDVYLQDSGDALALTLSVPGDLLALAAGHVHRQYVAERLSA